MKNTEAFDWAVTVAEAAAITGRERQVIARAARLGRIGGRTRKTGEGTSPWLIDIMALRAAYPPEIRRKPGRRAYFGRRDIINAADASPEERRHALEWDDEVRELTEQERNEADALDRLNRELARVDG